MHDMDTILRDIKHFKNKKHTHRCMTAMLILWSHIVSTLIWFSVIANVSR